ncbi:hypothetical protein H8S20_06965 [Clostridium sp. NSJ-6]|uniref:Uncharacterized protein n=1 Tax=Clostridium hominis TaxID=2763036 RepID=A0ABR7DB66_9CLOT|nr:hypothetical protein [Clostridium hominis]MBC5628637.1 hypothetical protein [Clostridium hominis]MDU2674120.1 hypothetical protein [Clostridium sp.]
MLVKIIDKTLDDYDKEFKVRRMNYDQVVVNYPSSKGIKVFNNSEIDFITESEVDEFLIKYNDFLKIKLNRGISVGLYKALLEIIESQLNIKFENLNLLRDKHVVNKRGIWEKEIIAVINKSIPVKILAVGQNFKKVGFNINLDQIDENEFFDMCCFEIEKIENEIKLKEDSLARYGMAIENLKKAEKNKSGEKPVKMLT